MHNPYPTNISPCETYIVEIDGKFESEYGTFMRALKAGLKLRQKFTHSQVKVRDASEQRRTDEKSETETKAALN
jgi:hypothetical protein